MTDFMKIFIVLAETQIPNLLVITGVVFLVMAFAGKIGAIIELSQERQKWAGIFGAMMLGLGISLFVLGGMQPEILENGIPTVSSSENLIETKQNEPITSEVIAAQSPSPPMPTVTQASVTILPTPMPQPRSTSTSIPLPPSVGGNQETNNTQFVEPTFTPTWTPTATNTPTFTPTPTETPFIPQWTGCNWEGVLTAGINSHQKADWCPVGKYITGFTTGHF